MGQRAQNARKTFMYHMNGPEMRQPYRESPGVQSHEVGDDDCSVRTESHVTEDEHGLVSAHLLI